EILLPVDDLPALDEAENLSQAAIITIVEPPFALLQALGMLAFLGHQPVRPVVTVRPMGHASHIRDFQVQSPIGSKRDAGTVRDPAPLIGLAMCRNLT